MNIKEKETVHKDEMNSIELANNFWEKVHQLEERMNKEEFKAGIIFVGGSEHMGSAGAGNVNDISFIVANGLHNDADIRNAVETAVKANEFAEKTGDDLKGKLEKLTEGLFGKTTKDTKKEKHECDVCGGDHETPDFKELEKMGDAGKALAELLKSLKQFKAELEK